MLNFLSSLKENRPRDKNEHVNQFKIFLIPLFNMRPVLAFQLALSVRLRALYS